ncbi:IS200/IS605 family transposase [Sedimentitalea sp. HM32M-2]
MRARDICGQVCCEKGDDIIRDVLSADHVHMFVSVPPGLAVSDLVRLMKRRSSHKVQRECAQLRQRYGGRRYWGRGEFSTTNGAITQDIVLHTWKNTSPILPAPAGRGSAGRGRHPGLLG